MNARTMPLTYESDAMFATGLLTLLRTRSSELSPTCLKTLQGIGCAQAVYSNDAERAIKELFSLCPEFARYAPTDMEGLCALPLWVWAREAVVSEEAVPFKRFSRRWKIFFGEERSSSARAVRCTRALQMTVALLDEMTPEEALQASIHWQDDSLYTAWCNIYTEDPPTLVRWQQASLHLGLLHEAVHALGVKEEKSPQKASIQTRWAAKLKNALEDMTFKQQTQCLTFWLNSALSATYKIRAAKGASPQVWLDPTLHLALDNLLPNSDSARWPMLPWVDHTRTRPLVKQDIAAQHNRDLMRLYCPQLALIVDAVAPAQLWTDRKAMVQLVTACTKKSQPVQDMPDVGNLRLFGITCGNCFSE